MKLFVLASLATAGTVAVVAATPQAQQWTQRQLIQEVHRALPEMTEWTSESGIQVEVRSLSSNPLSDRVVRIVDLDPQSPKLLHPTTGATLVYDDRAPASGFVRGNGQQFALMPTATPGVLEAVVPSGIVNWFGWNDFYARVNDASGAFICSFEIGVR